MGLGGFAREEGACNQAKEYYENGAGICRDLVAEFHDTGDRMNLALFYALLGGLSRMMGKTKKAKLYYEQCVDLWERILRSAGVPGLYVSGRRRVGGGRELS